MKKFLLTIVAAAVVALSMSSPADAAFKLRFSDGVNPALEITDGGAGDSNATVGAITYVGAYGDWIVNVTTGLSKPVFSASTPKMDLNSVNVSGAAGTLTIELTDTDFTGSGPLELNAGGTTNGSVTFTAGGGSSNTEYDLDNAVSMSFITPPTAFSGSGTTPKGVDPTLLSFSMTIKAVITHPDAGLSTSFNAELKAVPAPAGVLLLAAGLPCLAAGYIRRRKAAQA